MTITVAGVILGFVLGCVVMRLGGNVSHRERKINKESRWTQEKKKRQTMTLESLISTSRNDEHFLNTLVKLLWDNINVSLSKKVIDMFQQSWKDMLPAPLQMLQFEKLDFGENPLTFENIHVFETPKKVELEADIVWDGDCVIRLRALHTALGSIPLGIESFKFHGRISVSFYPMDILPVVSTIQYAFIDTPMVDFKLSGIANVAEHAVLKNIVTSTLNNLLDDALVVPDRGLIKIDPCADFFLSYQKPLGILRITVLSGEGFEVIKHGIFGFTILKDTPDVYCKIKFGGGKRWITSTKWNSTKPEWQESTDFMLCDMRQIIHVDVYNNDVVSSRVVGTSNVTAQDVLKKGGLARLQLEKEGIPIDTFLTISCQRYDLCDTLAPQPSIRGKGTMSGLLIVLIGKAYHVPIEDEENSAVCIKLVYGDSTFYTQAISHDATCDVRNPVFDRAFHIQVLPLNPVDSVSFSLCNVSDVRYTTKIMLSSVRSQADNTLLENIKLGSALLEVQLSLCGMARHVSRRMESIGCMSLENNAQNDTHYSMNL